MFGVELIRMGHLVIAADDGRSPVVALPAQNLDWSGSMPRLPDGYANGNGYSHGHPVGAQPHHHESLPPHEPTPPPPPPNRQFARPQTPVLETIRGMAAVTPPLDEPPQVPPHPPGAPPMRKSDPALAAASGEIVVRPKPGSVPAAVEGEIRSGEIRSGEIRSGEIRSGEIRSGEIRSGEIRSGDRSKPATLPMPIVAPEPRRAGPPATASGEIRPKSAAATPPPIPASAAPAAARPTLPLPPLPKPPPRVEVPQSAEEITEPAFDAKELTPLPATHTETLGPTPTPTPTPVPKTATPTPAPPAASSPPSTPAPSPADPESRGSILGIGMTSIGHGAVSGEIQLKVPPGSRVLVPGPNGLMQSATVRQLLQGYYELEVGSSGETIWVPIGGVVPE